MSIETDLARYLKRQGCENAAPEVSRVFKTLEGLAEALRAIPGEVQQEKADYLELVGHLEMALRVAKRIERRVAPAMGLNHTPAEQQWREVLASTLKAVRGNMPQPKGGRPRNIGEEKRALAVMGALLRHGAPEHKISAITTECLSILGMPLENIERAVRAARGLTKPTKN